LLLPPDFHGGQRPSAPTGADHVKRGLERVLLLAAIACTRPNGRMCAFPPECLNKHDLESITRAVVAEPMR